MRKTSIAVFVVACCALGVSHAQAARTTDAMGRRTELLNERPYPANRAGSPSEMGWGRLWVPSYPVGTRTPIREQTTSFTARGPRFYGESPEAWSQLVWVKNDHQPIGVSPWRTIHEDGLHRYRRAQSVWLKENGYTHKVRTHVNARYLFDHEQTRVSEIEPRAVIRIRERRSADEALQANNTTPRRGVIRVLGPERDLADASPAGE